MAITTLHQLNQALFDNRGVCYWVCEYMTREVNQNAKGAWAGWNNKNYQTLKTAAQQYRQYVSCFNWAKNQRNNDQEPVANYNFGAGGPLTANHHFRIAVYTGPSPMPSSGQNHEVMCVTGGGTSVLLFDPNFGFYELDATGIGAANNREALEHYLTNGYGNDCQQTAREYVYRDMGAIG
ncbi:hypothetical protein [Hahella ganghwensis]|uniref:hypothetical protein n=1 Tax=Hahella ganghwensis TaxID=286420 RepID=UPI0003A83CC7|nr:hypothetical protein [Hahella ganghwensis]